MRSDVINFIFSEAMLKDGAIQRINYWFKRNGVYENVQFSFYSAPIKITHTLAVGR
jgi:hypothetical protein